MSEYCPPQDGNAPSADRVQGDKVKWPQPLPQDKTSYLHRKNIEKIDSKNSFVFYKHVL